MPRFVVLLHDLPPTFARGLHWDLMLQHGDVLRTWSLARPPLPPLCIEAELLPDHRLAYLEYEGPVSGGRGCVTRWDQGMYSAIAVGEHYWEVDLHGRLCCGRLTLVHQEAQRWSLKLFKDPGSSADSRVSPT